MLIHFYRVANWLWRHHIPMLPKFIYYCQYMLFNSSLPASCKIMGGGKICLRRYSRGGACPCRNW